MMAAPVAGLLCDVGVPGMWLTTPGLLAILSGSIFIGPAPFIDATELVITLPQSKHICKKVRKIFIHKVVIELNFFTSGPFEIHPSSAYFLPF
jgi:hypothetical protein